MSKKINQNLNHVAKLGRSSFDMSKEVKFTSSVGHLLPVYMDYLNPGDKIKIGSSMFTRTKPLATPAFVSIEEHIDYFFVPIKQLYSVFGNLLTNMAEVNTSFLNDFNGGNNVSKVLPNVELVNAVETIFDYDHRIFEQDSRFLETYGIPKLFDFIRLCDLFGVNPSNLKEYIFNENKGIVPGISFDSSKMIHISLLPFLAYHKIYNDIYRLRDYEQENVQSFNLDRFWSGGATMSAVDCLDYGIFNIHYVPWHKDYFTNIYPNPLSLPQINSLGLSPTILDVSTYSSFGDVIGNTYGVKSSNYSSFPNVDNEIYNESVGHDDANRRQFNTSSIRAMFAYEKLLQITNFAPKTVDAQIAAHFGFKVPQGIDGQVYRIGRDESRIDIGEVVAQSDTLTQDGQTGAQLGALAGKGAGFKEGKAIHDFTAPCHGVLMALYWSVPTSDYEVGIDKLMLYNSVDNFPRPEFRELGMQPLYSLQFATSVSKRTGESSSLNPYSFVGFQWKWSELKQKYNTLHGDFIDTLPDWVVNRMRNTFDYPEDKVFSWLYSNPNALDSITETIYAPLFNSASFMDDYRNTSVFSRDPLMHWFSIHCYKTSFMDMYDLPNI